MDTAKVKKILFYVLLCAIFVLGFISRLKFPLSGIEFWHDDAALGLNMFEDGFLHFFRPLKFEQAAPPLFLVFSKILSNIFSLNDVSLRLIPLGFSLASLFVFYMLLKNVVKSKTALLFGMLLFAVNFYICCYGWAFKPYALDVFFTIFIIYIFLGLDFSKNNILKGFIFALIPWFSYASVFVLFSSNLILLFKNIKHNFKNFLFFLLPQMVSGIIFLIFTHESSKLMAHMQDFWNVYFFTFRNFIALSLRSFDYAFITASPILVFAIIIATFSGAILIYKENKQNFLFLFLPLFVLIFVSFLKLYPFHGRLILFVLPVYIISFAKSLDLILLKNKIPIILLSAMLLLAFFAGSEKMAPISSIENGKEICEIVKNNMGKEDKFFISEDHLAIRFYCSLNETPFEFKKYIIIKYLENNRYYWLLSLNNFQGSRIELHNKEIENEMSKYGYFDTYQVPTGFVYRFFKTK